MGKIEDKDIDLHIDRETLLQEYIPKAQYEQRLKADMVAMLEEIKNHINDYMDRKWEILTDADKVGCATIDDWKYHIAEVVDDYIQQKINSLKTEKGAEQ